jgi:hypothetical protein
VIVVGRFVGHFFDHTQPSNGEVLDSKIADLRTFDCQPAYHGARDRKRAYGESAERQSSGRDRERTRDNRHRLLSTVQPSAHKRVLRLGLAR